MTNTFDFLDSKGPVLAHRHKNGGGWVADTACVAESAYIGPDAVVYDNARVSGTARVYGNAQVCGNARVSGNARVYGNAVVYDKAQVYGNAVVYDKAQVCGNARVSGNARVYGNAVVYDKAQVCGNARVSGNAVVSDKAQVKRGEYTGTPVTITRSDGYTFTLQADGGVIAGCRDFTREQALTHWGDPRHHKHAESMAILTALYVIAETRNTPTEEMR